MTEKKMRLAGADMSACEWTDSELKDCIEATECTIAFLQGDDRMYHMVILHLQKKLSELSEFKLQRKK